MNKNIVITVGFIVKEIDNFRLSPSRNKNIVVTVGFIKSRKSIIFGSLRAGTKTLRYNCRFYLFKEVENFWFPPSRNKNIVV